MRTTFKMILIGILAILLAVTSSSQSYVKASEKNFTREEASATNTAGANCPAGEVKDWAGICFNIKPRYVSTDFFNGSS